MRQRCTLCLNDETVRNIRFNKEGLCNFCEAYLRDRDRLTDYDRLKSLFEERIDLVRGKHAYDAAVRLGYNPLVGSIASSDLFYDELETWKLWAEYGLLAIEMEAAELYTLAAKYKRQALTLLTISDNMVTHEETTAEERQLSFTAMMQTALEAIIAE